MLSCDHVLACVCPVACVYCLYCVSGEWSHCLHGKIQKCAGMSKDEIIAPHTLISLWECILYMFGSWMCLPAHLWMHEYVKEQTHILVSLASFCMISRIIRQAAEQPSGVEWMVMGFSAAPAFSLRWMSTLRDGEHNGEKDGDKGKTGKSMAAMF